MRRSNQKGDGSLELLLDTISNTFGGIIFISLLLVVLINTTSESKSKVEDVVSQSDLIQSETKREELTRRLSRLRSAYAAKVNSSKALISPDLDEALKKLREEEQTHAKLVQEKSEFVGELNRLQIQINQLDSQQSENEKNLQEARAELEAKKKKADELESTWSSVKGQLAREIKTPKQRKAGRLTSLQYFLVFGKLFGPVFYRDNRRNDVDFAFKRVDSTVAIDPKKENGLKINVDGSNANQIRVKLANARLGRNSVHIFVWEDSYREFDAIRVVLEDMSLAHAIVPWEPGDRMVLSSEQQQRWEQ